MSKRFYTSVPSFSAEFGSIFSAAIGLPEAADAADVQAQISSEPSAKDASTEYKEKKKLAKRIIKAVQGSLEDAMKKESELCRKPFEKELRDLDLLLQNSLLSRRDSLTNSSAGEVNEMEVENQILPLEHVHEYHTGIKGSSPAHNYISSIPRHETSSTLSSELSQPDASLAGVNLQEEPRAIAAETNLDVSVKPLSTDHISPAHQPTPEGSSVTPWTNVAANRDQVGESRPHVEPLTPALSSQEDVHPFASGGIPWYMVPFDPVGTTIEEERWTGRDLVRGMSEELSDMDEEELSGLVDMGVAGVPGEPVDGTSHSQANAGASNRRKVAAKRKRWRGYR